MARKHFGGIGNYSVDKNDESHGKLENKKIISLPKLYQRQLFISI